MYFFNVNFYKIQTNRVTLTKLICEFGANLEANECLISPRPLPRKTMQFYYALVSVRPNGKNINLIKKFKNCKEIGQQAFEAEKESIKFFWIVENKAEVGTL